MIEYRWYQQEALQSVHDYFAHKRGNPVIALPTGTGKSHIPAGLIHSAITTWPNQRFVVFAHVKELIQQNFNKLREVWYGGSIGIYSAGLKRREAFNPVVFAGIASIKNKVQSLGHRDLAFVDEAHLLSPNSETMYQKVFEEMRQINPNLKVVGLTATAYRVGQGMITEEGGLFTDICYDMTDRKGFARLIADGFMSPLIPKQTSTVIDVSSVGISKGDFRLGELQQVVDRKDITYQALSELVQYGADRKSWLIFATAVKHAEHIAAMLKDFGIPCAAVHSKIPDAKRNLYIKQFKAGQLRCLVNNNVLTTGFDHPPIDLIGMLRPTASPGLWVQMAGRGTRPNPGKENCVLLDYAGNTMRLGPIDDPQIPKKRGKGGGDAPVKICDECGAYNHISATECILCGHIFPRIEKITKTASEAELMGVTPQVFTHEVSSIVYHPHDKAGQPKSMRVTYYCDGGLKAYKEWIHFERSGGMGAKAREWWLARYTGHNPTPGSLHFRTTIEALMLTEWLAVPKTIRVWENKKYPEIIGYDF